MFIAPGSPETFERQLARGLSERLDRNYVVLAFDLKRLPDRVDSMLTPQSDRDRRTEATPDTRPRAAGASV